MTEPDLRIPIGAAHWQREPALGESGSMAAAEATFPSRSAERIGFEKQWCMRSFSEYYFESTTPLSAAHPQNL